MVSSRQCRHTMAAPAPANINYDQLVARLNAQRLRLALTHLGQKLGQRAPLSPAQLPRQVILHRAQRVFVDALLVHYDVVAADLPPLAWGEVGGNLRLGAGAPEPLNE